MRMRQKGVTAQRSKGPECPLLAAVALCALLPALPTATQPQGPPEEPAVEQVELNGVLHDVPPPWQGHRIGEAADPAGLVRVPANLSGDLGIYVTPETRDALVAMASAAREQGVQLAVDSGFRSFGFQKRILQGLLAEGRPFLNAVRWTAPPGYSEHMTGRVVDVVPSDATFKDTPAYRWLRRHAAAFCFTETYPLGNAGGFDWEPWHWRYDSCESGVARKAGLHPRRRGASGDGEGAERSAGVGRDSARVRRAGAQRTDLHGQSAQVQGQGRVQRWPRPPPGAKPPFTAKRA
jgi:hypothetical protein